MLSFNVSNEHILIFHAENAIIATIRSVQFSVYDTHLLPCVQHKTIRRTDKILP